MQNLSDEDRKKLARDIVKEFWRDVDLGLGRGLRKKLVYLGVILLLAGGLYFDFIKVGVHH